VSSLPIEPLVISEQARELLEMDPTLPAQLVHKSAIEEVFFTGFEMREDGSEFAIAAQLPRSHSLYSELEHGFHDLLLIMEIGRQSMTAYGHGVLGVPEGTAFVLMSSVAEVTDIEATRRRDGPAMLALPVPFIEGRRSTRGRVRKYNLTSMGSIDGRTAIALSGEAMLIPSSLYEHARGGGEDESQAYYDIPVPVAPSRVGRVLPRNVVVGDAGLIGGELRCAVVVDTSHPSFFDHPLDHIPAMLMLEAARQAAILFAGESCGWPAGEAVLVRCDARFTRYAALAPPVNCRVLRQTQEVPLPGESLADGAAVEEILDLRAHFEQAAENNGYADVRLRRMAAGDGGGNAE
jgi:2-oxo-3-(phosphooxy)propyl 3-oxoalkanoate synthase